MSVQWVTIVSTSTFFGIVGPDIARFTETIEEPVSTTARTFPSADQFPNGNSQPTSTSLSFPPIAPTDSGATTVLAGSIPQMTSTSPDIKDMSAPDVSAVVQGSRLESSTTTSLETTAWSTQPTSSLETFFQNSAVPSLANAVVPTHDGPHIKIALVLGITIVNCVLLVFTVWHIFRRKQSTRLPWWKSFKWGTRYSLKPVPYDLELHSKDSAVTLTPLDGAPATRKEKEDTRDNPGTLHSNRITRALADVKGVQIPSRVKQKSDPAKRNVPDTAQVIPSVPHTSDVNGW